MARELSLEGRARERFLALPHCQNCSCENLFQEVPCQLKLTPELSRAVLWPRRCDTVRHSGAATKRSRLERIVRRRLAGMLRQPQPVELTRCYTCRSLPIALGIGR